MTLLVETGSSLLFTVAGPNETTYTRIAKRLSPSATTAQATTLAARNGYALTTAVKPGQIIAYLSTDFVSV